jgi:hypothetical protein
MSRTTQPRYTEGVAGQKTQVAEKKHTRRLFQQAKK